MEKIHVFITSSPTSSGDERVKLIFAEDQASAEKQLVGLKIRRYDGAIPLKLFVDQLAEMKKLAALGDKNGKEIGINASSSPSVQPAATVELMPMVFPKEDLTNSTNSQLVCFAKLLVDKAVTDEKEKTVMNKIIKRLEGATK